MHIPYKIIRPAIMKLDPETAHGLTIRAMKNGLMPLPRAVSDPRLIQTLWDRQIPNPVGMAAGFDKNAEVIGALFRMGFGLVEAGTVTPKPQQGNPKPRIFRHVAGEAVINAMGFPNHGLNAFRAHIEAFLSRKARPQGLLGINIGMNKDQKVPEKDYTQLIHQLGPLADYLAVNISSPNTPGLRNLQARENLLPLLATLLEARDKACRGAPPPLLVKLAPDLDNAQQADIARTVLEAKIDGLILTNTTLDRPDSLPDDFKARKGGLSGRPVREKSTALINSFYELTGGNLPIIGVGGIHSGEDAYEKIRAGASLVQIYSGMVYHGPELLNDIKRSLLAALDRDGFCNINEAVGADHKKAASGKRAANG